MSGSHILSNSCPLSTFCPTFVHFLSFSCPLSVHCPIYDSILSLSVLIWPSICPYMPNIVQLLSCFGPHSKLKTKKNNWTKVGQNLVSKICLNCPPGNSAIGQKLQFLSTFCPLSRICPYSVCILSNSQLLFVFVLLLTTFCHKIVNFCPDLIQLLSSSP